MKNAILLLAFIIIPKICTYAQDYQENDSTKYYLPVLLDSTASIDSIEELITKGSVNFIIHGIDSSIPDDYNKFKEKYGIGLFKENCTIDPITSKRSTNNNQVISAYLNKKYGDLWRNDLISLPYGLK